MRLGKPILVFFHGDADTGKTTVLSRLSELLRSKSTEYKEERPSSKSVDKKCVAVFKGVKIGVGTSGDSDDLVLANLKYFSKECCDIAFTAARHDSNSVSYNKSNRGLAREMAKFNIENIARNQALKKNKQCNIKFVREDDLLYYVLVLISKNTKVQFHLQ